MTALLLAPIALPVALALLLVVPALRRPIVALAPLTALAPLALAVLAPDGAVALPSVLLGMRLGLDEIGRVLLLVVSLVWLFAGLYALGYVARRRARFFAFHLLAMAGNAGLCLAADVVTFYLCFALMTYAAYGLVVHDRTPTARRAGRVYLVLAVVGEALLLAGILAAAASMKGLALADVPAAVARAEHRDGIVALLFVGFGVKAAVLGLHVWLPLAHPAAPTPASAALSGAMIKAGLLGWLRFLPLGEGAWVGLGVVIMTAGIVGAYYGALVGLTQRDPKAVLAYSSMSQMGLMTLAVGVGLAVPAHASAAIGAAAIYALHHGLAKASLFLSVGVVGAGVPRRFGWLVAAGVALPILALAGLPLTSGAVAKAALGTVLYEAPFAERFAPLAALAASATTLVLLRFAWLARARFRERAEREPARWMLAAWSASVLATVGVIWLLPWVGTAEIARASLTVAGLWPTTWPFLLGVGLAALAVYLARRGATPVSLPPGDLVVTLERGLVLARGRVDVARPMLEGRVSAWRASLATGRSWLAARLTRALAFELRLAEWRAGTALLVVALLLLFALQLAASSW